MISKKNILKLEIRRKIYDFVDKNPGLHVREISRRMDIPINTLIYHIKYLKKLGLIDEKHEGKYNFIFITQKIGKQDKQILGLLRKKTSCKIFLHLLFSLSCSQIELSKELEISPASVSYHLKKMLDIGIIEEAPVENGKIYPLKNLKNPILKDCVIELKPLKGEKFYRRKNQEFINAVYRVLIAYKHGLSDENLIDMYLEWRDESRKKWNEEARRIKLQKLRGSDEDGINSILDFILEFFKPPFAA